MSSSRFTIVAVALTLAAACGSSGSNDVTQTSSSAGGSSGAGGGSAGNGGGAAGTGGSLATTGGAAGTSSAGSGGAAVAGGGGVAGAAGAGTSGAAGVGTSGAGGASAGAAGAAGGCSIPSMCQKTSCCGGPTGSCDFSACQWGCPAPMLCPNLMVIPGGPPGGPTPDPAIVACVMNALRDGTEGAISWSQLGPAPGGSYGESIHILPARKALREASQQNDLAPATYFRDGPSPLGDAATFDACATSTNSSVILGCLQKAVTGCGP